MIQLKPSNLALDIVAARRGGSHAKDRGGGPIAETIATHASRSQSDFVYMGTHGRGAISGALLGSVVMGVLHRRPCPVVVVP